MIATLHYRRLWMFIGWGLILLIIYLSLTPRPPQPAVGLPFGDKIGHGLAYFSLMSWFAQLYQNPRHRLYLAIGFMVLGGGLEILQGLGGVRSADIWDFLANTSGVLIAGLAVFLTKFGVILFVIEQHLTASKSTLN